MTTAQWAALAAVIQARWPQQTVTDDWLAAWYPIVADLTAEEAAAALDGYSRQDNQWPPNGGSLWAAARGNADAAAQDVAVALRAEAANSGRRCTDERVQAVAAALGGWQRLGRMSDEDWRYLGPQVREALAAVNRRQGAPLPAPRKER